MDYRKSKLLLEVMALLGVACTAFMSAAPFIGVVGVIIMFGGIAQGYAFCRCPHCGSSLMNVRDVPDYCPRCGKKL